MKGHPIRQAQVGETWRASSAHDRWTLWKFVRHNEEVYAVVVKECMGEKENVYTQEQKYGNTPLASLYIGQGITWTRMDSKKRSD